MAPGIKSFLQKKGSSFFSKSILIELILKKVKLEWRSKIFMYVFLFIFCSQSQSQSLELKFEFCKIKLELSHG